jgi:ATP-binding cassette subfamily B multidrug efflux pump
MLDRLFRWFETRTEAFSAGEAGMPPATLSGFIWFYTKPFWPWIAVTSMLAALVAVIEVSLFAFLGSVVDWLAKTTPDTVFQDYSWQLLLLAGLVLLLHPLLNFIYELIVHQTLMGNYPMRIRWEAHRYVLRQSLEFFQNDFAGALPRRSCRPLWRCAKRFSRRPMFSCLCRFISPLRWCCLHKVTGGCRCPCWAG